MGRMPRREELINGQRVEMPPRPSFNHNRVALNISLFFTRTLEGTEYAVVVDGSDLYLTEDNRFVPDIMIVRNQGQLQPDGVHGAPELVVEVLCPGTARRAKTCKRAVYGRCGVREYWVVDPARKILDVYHSTGDKLVLYGAYALVSDARLAKMSEKGRASVTTHFQCGLLGGLDISLKEIFYRT